MELVTLLEKLTVMIKNKLPVSIIIRTLNEENNIGNCLDKLSLGDNLPSEVIIVDNYSDDSTLDKVKKHEKILNIKVIRNPYLGFSSGLNIGFKESKYDYIGYLSADCFPNKQWLGSLYKTIKDNDADVVQGIEIPSENSIINKLLSKETIQNKNIKSQITRIKFFSNTNCIYKKKTLAKYMPFTDISEQGGEDTLMSIKYLEKGHSAYSVTDSKVQHNLFNDFNEFKARNFKHGKQSINFLFKYPKYPRIYMNSIYWTLIDIKSALKLRDINYIKLGFYRLSNFIHGAINGLIIKLKLNLIFRIFKFYKFNSFIILIAIYISYIFKIKQNEKITYIETKDNIKLSIRNNPGDFWELVGILNNNEYGFINNYRFNQITSKKEINVLDLGSHIGLFPIYLKSIGLSINKFVSVEPNKQNIKLLKENIPILVNSFSLIEKAVVVDDNQKYFYHSDLSSNMGFVNKSSKFGKQIDTISLNRLLNNNDQFNIIKLDIEGSEWDIFGNEHLKNLLIKKSDMVVIEYHDNVNNICDYKYLNKTFGGNSIYAFNKIPGQTIVYLKTHNKDL